MSARMPRRQWIGLVLRAAAAAPVLGLWDPASSPVTTRRVPPAPSTLDRTSFQTNAPYSSDLDLGADTVMVYANALHSGLKGRMASWAGHGYRLTVMGSISHDWTGEFANGGFDSQDHIGSVQQTNAGTLMTIGSGYYMVPTEAWANYLVAIGEHAAATGAEAYYLEEPEFWLRAGYSPAFQAAWKTYYGEPWEDPLSSEKAMYRAGQLKARLYVQLARDVFGRLRAKHPKMRLGIAAHSNLNYLQWGIVCPHYGLYAVPETELYIGQIWGSTLRSPVPYLGGAQSMPTLNGWLEYSTVAGLPAQAGKRRWFLADPKSDAANKPWTHYRHGYEDAVVSSLSFPEVDRFELVPWPERVFTGGVPQAYGQQLLATYRVLEAVGGQSAREDTRPGEPRIAAFTSDSVMWQGQPDRLYGLVLPLLTRGIRVPLLTLEGASAPGYLGAHQILLLSYDPLKPLDASAHQALAAWVRAGGRLLLVRGFTDFDQVGAWWSQGGVATPQEDLLRRLGLDARNAGDLGSVGNTFLSAAPGLGAPLPQGLTAVSGTAALYSVQGAHPLLLLGTLPVAWRAEVGRGQILYASVPSSYFGASAAGGELLLWLVRQLAAGGAPIDGHAVLATRRGPWVSALGITGGTVAGRFADVQQPGFPMVQDPEVRAGGTGLFRVVDEAMEHPQLLCTTLRVHQLEQGPTRTMLVGSGPTSVPGQTRLYSPRAKPIAVRWGGQPLAWQWEDATASCLVTHPMAPAPTALEVDWHL